jgi:hypothetical protein
MLDVKQCYNQRNVDVLIKDEFDSIKEKILAVNTIDGLLSINTNVFEMCIKSSNVVLNGKTEVEEHIERICKSNEMQPADGGFSYYKYVHVGDVNELTKFDLIEIDSYHFVFSKKSDVHLPFNVVLKWHLKNELTFTNPHVMYYLNEYVDSEKEKAYEIIEQIKVMHINSVVDLENILDGSILEISDLIINDNEQHLFVKDVIGLSMLCKVPLTEFMFMNECVFREDDYSEKYCGLKLKQGYIETLLFL